MAPEPQAMPPPTEKARRVSDESRRLQSAAHYLGNLQRRGAVSSSHAVFYRPVFGFDKRMP